MGGIWKISIALLFQHSIFTDRGFAQEVETVFKTAGIVPKSIPVAPQLLLSVEYPSGVSVELGNTLTPSQTVANPDISLPDGEVSNDDFHTLIMFDPDAISSDVPIVSDFVHWLVVNIPGLQVESGETLGQYVGPTPPLVTGLHRYVFLVYRQPSRLVFDELSLLEGYIFIRSGFSVTGFVAKYNLGDPIAGNFFRAQFDGVGIVINIVDGIGG